ncbi:MAG: hypothetical protein ACKV2V_26480, partial [Blastocatellia bacterium]
EDGIQTFKISNRRDMMKTKLISVILLALFSGAFSAMAMTGQSGKAPSQMVTQDKKEMSHADMMKMESEPHHLLAMAYHQNLATFAMALHRQTSQASAVNVEFARVAVAEMRRSFDQMKQHHQEHMKTMSEEMRAGMTGMMKEMETHRTEVGTQLEGLEREMKLSAPEAKKVAAMAASVNSHLEAMSGMHQGGGAKMKMKH